MTKKQTKCETQQQPTKELKDHKIIINLTALLNAVDDTNYQVLNKNFPETRS